MIVLSLLFVVLFAGCVSSAQENSLEDVCNNATNGSWDSDGFVCVTEFSHFYVNCNKTDGSACFLACPSGTKCSAPAGKFVDSNPCMKSSRCCGNTAAEFSLGEQCDGGDGCNANCQCMDGYVPTSPVSAHCSKCGNGVVDEGEECDGTEGCLASCVCGGSYVPSDGVCVYNNSTNNTLEGICSSLTICEKDSGYVCLGEDSPQYLRCHLEERVAVMMSCSSGTLCRAPVGVFQLANPCLSGETSYASEQYFPNQTAAMEELSRSSPCIEGNQDNPSTKRAVLVPAAKADVVCIVYGTAGFYCSSIRNSSASPSSYVECVNGTGEKLECPPGEVCVSDGFANDLPCVPIASNSSVCGDGVLGANEECEINGFGCDTSKCECKPGYYPSDPQKVDCLLNYTEACMHINNGSLSTPVYFCPILYSPDANSSEYVKCLNGVPTREVCETNAFCTEKGFYDDVPCKDMTPKCGNGIVEFGEECEIDGNGCDDATCKCRDGYHPTDPPTTNCVGSVTVSVTYNYTKVCEEYGTAGYFCASIFDDPDCRRVNSSVFVQCGEHGLCAGVLTCAQGTYCSAPGFTIATPCTYRDYCGNGKVDGNEECEVGGFGCNNVTCACEAGYTPKDPPEMDCTPNPLSLQCIRRGRNGDVPAAICPEDDDTAFIMCTGENALSSYKMSCPPGTLCVNKTKADLSNPCEIPASNEEVEV